MSQQDLPKVTVQGGHLMLGEEPLYMCTVHRGCGKLPFYIEGDGSWGERKDWISCWKPVIGKRSSDDSAIHDGDLEETKDERKDGRKQATFRGYQLYTFEPGDKVTKGEVPGFWELVTPETSRAEDDRRDCDDDGGIQPSNARGP